MMFYPAYCVFQELGIGRTIGSGKTYGGLYLLETELSSESLFSSCVLKTVSTSTAVM